MAIRSCEGAGMRGAEYEQSSMFSYISAERRVPKDHPLRAIRTVADAALKELDQRFEGMYAAMGRPSIPPERLLRALLLQVLYTVRSERLLMERPVTSGLDSAGIVASSTIHPLTAHSLSIRRDAR